MSALTPVTALQELLRLHSHSKVELRVLMTHLATRLKACLEQQGGAASTLGWEFSGFSQRFFSPTQCFFRVSQCFLSFSHVVSDLIPG